MAQKYFTKTTPFIRPITKSGGTFYVFNSASEDFGLSFSDFGDRKFVFSKYALLKIPEISNNPDRYNENLVRLKAIPGAFKRIEQRGQSQVNLNTYFAESLQNYMLNFETGIISAETYDQQNPHTVAEYAFWKWLKELGAIRFQNKENSSGLYIEEEDYTNKYERVVKYIGDIDVSNNYYGSEESYLEIYFRLPADAGKFKNIYFQSFQEDNYKANNVFSRNTDSYNNYFIYGKKSTDIHPITNFDTFAYYDNPDANKNTDYYLKKLLNSTVFDSADDFSDAWWYTQGVTNSYMTEPSENYSSAENDILAITNGSTDISTWTIFKRSRLDGINIDFNIDDYLSEYSNLDYTTFTDIATSPFASDFEFNAVLIYYDILDNSEIPIISGTEDDIPETAAILDSGGNVLATNLFGIYFLDNVNVKTLEENNVYVPLGSGIIPSIQKCVPNEITHNSGNAYNGRIKFKIDTSPINAYTEKITHISDSNTFSMEMFFDALNTMRTMSSQLIANLSSMANATQVLNEIKKSEFFTNPLLLQTINSRLENIEKFQTTFDALFNSYKIDEIANLITDNNSFMQDIKNGNIETLKVANELFESGPGISITNNSSTMKFSLNNTYNINTDSIVYTPNSTNEVTWRDYTNDKDYYYYEYNLKELNNYIRFSANNWQVNRNLLLKINDSYVNWKKGQVFRISFDGNFILNDKMFKIESILRNNIYQKTIFTANSNQFVLSNSNPIFEIICVDEINHEFIIDILK